MVKDSRARIVKKNRWGDYCVFTLESPAISAEAHPGQFIMVRISSHPYPLLRRPFSIHSGEGSQIEIFFQKTGLGTSLLIEKNEGDSLDIIGPLGSGFSLHPTEEGKEVAAVGGGRGIAPLYFLARKLRQKGVPVQIFYGGKTSADLPLKEKFEKEGSKLHCSTDDGTFGFHGFVSGLFKEEIQKISPSHVFACGPEAMLEKISAIAAASEIPAEASLESLMGCGFGACWGCVKKIKQDKTEEWIKVCEKGPVFFTGKILWNEEP